MKKLLQTKGLTLGFTRNKKQILALQDVNFSINQGESVALIGESGSGKSQFALALLQLNPKQSIRQGELFWKEELVDSREKIQAIRGKGIAITFQDAISSLNPIQTINTHLHEILSSKGFTYEESQSRALELLSRVGFTSPKRVLSLYPHQLSGGMARRVTIAQLLLLQPELMILDEPTAGLDTIARQEFMGMLKGILNSHAQSLLFITHDLRLLPGLTDRISIMLRGFLIEDRLAGALIRNPLHPYSQKLHQLLRGKSVHNQGTEENQRNRSLQGCPFSGECPQVMPICLEHLPPPVLIPKEGMVRCFLHANKTTN